VPVTLRVITPLVLAGSALVLLTGCNSSTTSTSDTSSPAASATAGATSPAAAPSGVPSALPSDAQAQFAKIQQCLSAAGINLPAPSLPAGATPGGSFSPPAGGGAGGGQLNDPQVKAALEACGLSLPSGAPGGASPGSS